MTEPTARISVLVVDDHPPFALGLAALINQQHDMKSVGVAANANEALQQTRETKPDVIVMDISMPGMNGIDATRRIKEEFPGIMILVLSAYGSQYFALSALEVGAAGYLVKNVPLKDLLNAIRTLRDGDIVLDKSLVSKLLRKLAKTSGSGQGSRLDETELKLLKLGALGISNKEISVRVFMAERTVQARFTGIFHKLGVASRMEAVLYALKEGWLTIDDLS
jgi:DNA-binding NarL/FixJ family response regulator